MPGNIIILHKYTKNHDHMLYCSWDMAHDACNYFSFWAIFCPFTPVTAKKMKISKTWKKFLKISFYISMPKIMIICYTVPEIWRMTDIIVTFHFGLFFALLPPLTAQKIKISKTWKKLPEISSFYTSVPKIMIICYTVPEIWHVTHVIIFHFGLFFALLPPTTAQKMKISKKWKKCWEISSFYICVPKLWLDNVQFLRYGAQQTDGQMEKWMDGRKVTYRGGCPT